MGFLDTLKEKLLANADDDDFYEDDYDSYYDDPQVPHERTATRSDEDKGSGLLGNTSRPEADSVAVYTRSGRPLDENLAEIDDAPSYADEGSLVSPSAVRTPSGQLPAYILRPVTYDDIQSVIRRVRTNQPVVLVLDATDHETAKRILDFSFGLACGIDGSVTEIGEAAFVVLPQGAAFGRADIDRLIADGTIKA